MINSMASNLANTSTVPETRSYGAWDSPILAKSLASAEISFAQIAPNHSKTTSDPNAADKMYYIEARPAEQGRRCIVECSFLPNSPAQLRDVLPLEYSARTSVHGYGGGAFACQYSGNLIFSDGNTNGVYALDPQTKQVECIISGDKQVFFADFDAAHDDILQNWILAIREHHDTIGVTNSIVAIDLETKMVHTVMAGADFYAHPQLYVSTSQQAMVCWTEWDHPNMPWTGSRLKVASWSIAEPSNGRKPTVDEVTCVAGKSGSEGIAQPKWNHEDGSLLFCSDLSGYWQLYYLTPGQTSPSRVTLQGLEDGNFAGPEWWLASSYFTFLDRDTVIALWTKDAVQRLVLIDMPSSKFEFPTFPSIENSAPSIHRVSDQHYVLTGSTTKSPETLYSVASRHQIEMTVVKSSTALSIPSTSFSTLEPISFPRVHGPVKEGLAHAMFMPPLNPKFVGPKGTLPPLILYMHGGPTIHIGPGLNMVWQYWTTRGYAYAAVNYAGSSGYSRTYRQLLDGQWGVADVADAASCVEHLASAGLIDKTRVGVTGGSAGGYACLQALSTYPNTFAGGVSLYGISDVKTLIQDTHKFESHYADRLLFGTNADLSDEEMEKIIHARSPLYHAENIKAALLLLQGSEDTIVPPNQAQRMIDAIKKNNGAVEAVFFEGEGHGFTKAANIERSILEQERWWRKSLVRDMEPTTERSSPTLS